MVTAVCQKDMCSTTFAHINGMARIQILINFQRILSILKCFAGGAAIILMTFLSMFRSFRHHYPIPFRKYKPDVVRVNL